MSSNSGFRTVLRAVSAVVAALFFVMCGSAQAQVSGPAYPAPGGNTFGSNGVGLKDAAPAPRIGTYSAFSPSAFGSLYFGLSGEGVGVSMDTGNTISGSEWMTVSYVSDNHIAFLGTGSFFDAANSTSYVAINYFDIVLYDSSSTPINWISAGSVGATASNPYGYVADVTAAAASGGFYYDAYLLSCVDSWGCSTSANVFSSFHANGGGSISLLTSMSSGFWSTSPVPEPETYAMLLAGLGLLGFAARRRKQKELAAA